MDNMSNLSNSELVQIAKALKEEQDFLVEEEGKLGELENERKNPKSNK